MKYKRKNQKMYHVQLRTIKVKFQMLHTVARRLTVKLDAKEKHKTNLVYIQASSKYPEQITKSKNYEK